MDLAHRIKGLQPSPTLALTEKATNLKRQGYDIATLSVGEPDFPTPSWVIEAAHIAAQKGQTRYTPVGGTAELKEAIIKKFERENNLSYQSNQVMASTGGKQVIFNAFFATLNDDDEVIIPSPYWVSYPEMVGIFGAKSVIIETSFANNFKISASQLEQAITPLTKWLILNAPSNPTGMVYSCDELALIGEVLEKHPHVMVLCDDIYEHLIYDQKSFHTLAQIKPALKKRILIVNGVSKSYAMTGWRIGYGAGSADLIEAMTNIQSQSTSNPCSIAQAAVVAALNGDQTFLQEWRNIFQIRRDVMLNKFATMADITCLKPDGAFYLFPNIQNYLGRMTVSGSKIQTDIDLSQYLLEEAQLAVVPGSVFGASGYLRFSFAVNQNVLTDAAERLLSALKRLK